MSCKATSLFTLAVALLLSASVRSANIQIFNQIHDLNKSTSSLIGEIVDYLKEMNDQFILQGEQLHEVLSAVPKFGTFILESNQQFDNMPPQEFEEYIGKKFVALFNAAREHILNGNEVVVNEFKASCHKLFAVYAIYYNYYYSKHQQETMPEPKDLPLLKLITNLSKDVLGSLRTRQTKITTVTTTISKEVKATLDINAHAESRIKDFLEFKRNPIGVLLRSAKVIIAAANEDPEALGQQGEPAIDRIHEYAKAAVIISKQRSQNPIEPLIDLIKDLTGRTHSNGQMTNRPTNYKWNVGLLQKLFKELSNNGAQAEAFDQIESFLGKNHPANLNRAYIKSAIQQHYNKRVGSNGSAIQESDYEKLPAKRQIIDYIIHLNTPKDEAPIIVPADKNSIVNHFEPLAMVPAGPAVFSTFEPGLFEKIDSYFNLPDVAPRVYEEIINFRDEDTGLIPLIDQIKEFDQFLDARLTENPQNPISGLYVPFKLFLAKTFLNEEDYDTTFAEIPEIIQSETKETINDPKLGPIKQTAIALFAKKNGKVTPKNIEEGDYVPDLSNRKVNTFHINDLTYEVTLEEPQPVLIKEDELNIPPQDLIEDKKIIDQGLTEEGEDRPHLLSDELRDDDFEYPLGNNITELENLEEQLQGTRLNDLPNLAESQISPKNSDRAIEIQANKLAEQPIGTVVNVVAGAEYIPEELLDKIRRSDDVEKVIVEFETVIEEDEPVDVVIIRIVRSGSPCYKYEMEKLARK